jgi:hypothetical protein
MGEQQEQNGDFPVWVRVLFRYGIVGFLALAFAYVLIKDVREALAAVHIKIDAHTRRSEQDQSIMRFYLRQLCLNTGTSEQARSGCMLPEEAR